MNFTQFKFFLIIYLALVAFVSLDDIYLTLGLALSYGIAFMLRQWIWYDALTKSKAIDVVTPEQTQFFFLGTSLPHDEEHELEVGRLRNWIFGNGIVRFFVSSGIVLIFPLLVLKYVSGSSWTLKSSLFQVVSLLILSTIYYEHLLLIIFAGVLFFCFSLSDLRYPGFWIFWFMFLLSSNLFLYSWSRPNAKKTKAKPGSWAFSGAFVFILLWVLFDTLVPQRLKFNGDQVPIKSKIAHDASRIIKPGPNLSPRQTLRAYELARRVNNGELIQMAKESGVDDPTIRDLADENSNNLEEIQVSEADRKELSDLLGKMSGRDAESQQSIATSADTKLDSSVESDLKAIKEEVGKLMQQGSQREGQLTNEEREYLKSLAKKLDEKELGDIAQQIGVNKEELHELVGGGLDKVDGVKKSQEASHSVKRERESIRKKIEFRLTSISKFLLFIGAVLGVGALMAFILNLRKKKMEDEVEEEGKTKKDKKALVRAYNQIFKRKIAPREEVIKTYNIFLELMDGKERGKPSYLPTSEYTEKLTVDFPELKQDLTLLNEVFCDTLFAKKDPSEVILRFRKSFLRVANETINH